MMGKPDVDHISGLSPAISIEQKTTSKNPRSTVGTVTEIYDYLRLLFARVGTPYSPATGLPITAMQVQDMVDAVMAMPKARVPTCWRPSSATARASTARSSWTCASRASSASRSTVPSMSLEEPADAGQEVPPQHRRGGGPDRGERGAGDPAGRQLPHRSEPGGRDRGDRAAPMPRGEPERITYSEKFACPSRGFTIAEIEPRLFSFNAPFGACPVCDGLGVELFFDERLVVPDQNLTLMQGAIAPWSKSKSPYLTQTIDALSKHYGFNSRPSGRTCPIR
jgi:excinuclease ABC subunit A